MHGLFVDNENNDAAAAGAMEGGAETEPATNGCPRRKKIYMKSSRFVAFYALSEFVFAFKSVLYASCHSHSFLKRITDHSISV